jgi:arginyl-tRNA synthetase
MPFENYTYIRYLCLELTSIDHSGYYRGMLKELERHIKAALQAQGIESPEVAIEHPELLSNGDYSTSAALAYAKELGKNPKEITEEIKKYIEENKLEGIEKIEIAGPGFINFYLNKDFFKKNLEEIIKKGDGFGIGESMKEEKIMVEHTDPNPFKEFHVGHLMPNIIGHAIANILRWNGAEVKEACYQGDVGLHVAKAIAVALESDNTPGKLQKGIFYTEGNKRFEEDEGFKKKVIEINKKIYTRQDENINSIYDAGRKLSLEYFDSLYKRLGIKFDYFFFESESAKLGKEIIEENTGDIFEESQGAIVFHAENYDPSLHTRVFINSEGLPTYEAKELGLAKIKYEKYPYTRSIVVTGNEIKDYFKVLLAAMKFIFPDLREKTKHLPHGMLRLPSGKMSSRSGDVITAEWLIEAVKAVLGSKGLLDEMPEQEKEQTKEDIAIGAIKYMILRQSIGNDIIFDFEKSLSIDGDSGPYLQYAYARTNSLIAKAGKKGSLSGERKNLHEIEKTLYRFPEIVERSMKEYAPNLILTYLVELAGSFNNFYAHEKIISEDSESDYKLAIAEAFRVVLKNGLTILGIPTPERM